MNNSRAIAYSEVYSIINKMNKKYLIKIPKAFRDFIIEQMDEDYKPEIDVSVPLENQNLQPKTFAILAMINLEYWCEDEKHREELLNAYRRNSMLKEQKLREQYNIENIFKNKKSVVENEIAKDKSTSLTIHRESFIKKFINKIKNIFYK